MKQLAILDAATGTVMIIKVNDRAVRRLEENYDDNVELWFSEDGYEEKFCLNISCCQWMWMEEENIEKHSL